MRTRIRAVGMAVILATAGTTALGQSVVRREGPPDQGRAVEPAAVIFAGPWNPTGGSGATQIVGSVIDIRQTPVANARVQLRDLRTGAVVEEVLTNENGEYAFDELEPGTYVVEMVLATGGVVALSSAGSLARYETFQTVVQLPGRWDTITQNVVTATQPGSFVGLSSAATMTAATLEIAINQNIAPVNPGVPISP